MGDLIWFWLQGLLCTEYRSGVHIAQHYFSPNNKSTPLIWEMNYNNPNYSHAIRNSAHAGGRGQKELLASVKPWWKTSFLQAADSDSTRTTGKVRQIAKKMVFWLEASTASHLCVCRYNAFHTLPYRQTPQKKRVGKKKDQQESATQSSSAMLWRTFILSQHLLDFCLCVGDWLDQVMVQISSRVSLQASLLTHPRKQKCGN